MLTKRAHLPKDCFSFFFDETLDFVSVFDIPLETVHFIFLSNQCHDNLSGVEYITN